MVLGNRRLISTWPVRGGPVVADDTVYFAAGVWSFEGVFVLAVDAATGDLQWVNDGLGYVYGSHPHNASAIGGLTPQGYLVVNGDELIVPCSAAYPARLDRATGETVDFELPAQSRLPGGWFAATDKETAKKIRRGEIVLDGLVSRQEHEDRKMKGASESGSSRQIHFGELTVSYAEITERLGAVRDPLTKEAVQLKDADVHSVIGGGDRVFVVTKQGTLMCFSAEAGDEVVHQPEAPQSAPAAKETVEQVTSLLKQSVDSHGIAILTNVINPGLPQEIVKQSNLHVIVIADNDVLASKLRQSIGRSGMYGQRISVIVAELEQLPPFISGFVAAGTAVTNSKDVASLLRTLHPYRGVACFLTDQVQHEALAQLGKTALGDAAHVERVGKMTVVRREGGIPGAKNYIDPWQATFDDQVSMPLGVLWYDDSLGHFKRSPQPKFIDGVMVSHGKDWHASRFLNPPGTDYPLEPAVLSDMYTGRILSEDEATDLRKSLEPLDLKKREPSQYRPPTQKDAWKPGQPKPGNRINPLTLMEEVRQFPKSYGCDGGVDYGNVYSMRSGTAAYYDKRLESGTVHISGPRSGCTNSIIPAGGLLNVPYFYEGCTCSYPLPVGLALRSMPSSYEQWACWGKGKPEQIQRIGLNFGAPGDRVSPEKTLWMEAPSVGGPSPQLEIEMKPENPNFFYRHSVWMKDGEGWPWVNASGVEGLEELKLRGLKPGNYIVRLYFAERDTIGRNSANANGIRRQTISLQGKPVLESFNIAEVAGGSLKGVVREFRQEVKDGEFTLNLKSLGKEKTTLISGIELVRDGLKLDPVKVAE
jgi:hypothetical protein